MKQFLFALLPLCVSATVTTNRAYAQNTVNTEIVKPGKNFTPLEKVTATPNNYMSNAGAINPKALKNFARTYKNVTDESWLKIKDGFIVWFVINGVKNKVFYNTKGRWTGSLKQYSEDKMPQNIKAIIKSEYYDYSIIYVIEVENINSADIPTYLIHLEDKNNIKLVRIYDGQMDVWKEFQKN